MTVPRGIVPALVILSVLAGLGGAKLIEIPSLDLDFSSPGAGSGTPASQVTLLVDGVKCVDTAQSAASTLAEITGIQRFVAYASRNRVDVTYDPSRVDVDQIREALEGPVFDEESGEFFFGVFKVIEIDGRPVSE